MITPAQRAEIRRLFYDEHWKLGIIAAQLGFHHQTVRAAVERETRGFRRGACRPSIDDVGVGIAVTRSAIRMPAFQPAGCRDCASAGSVSSTASADSAVSNARAVVYVDLAT